MAVADLGIGLTAQPVFILLILAENNIIHLQGRIVLMYDIFRVFCMHFGGASVVCIAAVAVEKCLAILLHLRFQEIITTSRTTKLTVTCWVLQTFSISINFFLIREHSFVLLGTLLFLLCIILVGVSYLIIFRNVRRHRRQIKQLESAVRTTPAIRQGRSLRNMFFIHGVFALCVVPALIYFVWSLVTMKRNYIFWMLASTCVFLNSTVNPFLYFWRLKEMRNVVFKMLGFQNTGRG